MSPMKNARVMIFDEPGSPLRAETWPLPETLGEGEVLVELTCATVCGSDLHTIAGTRKEPTPAILGHEGVGCVAATGPGRDLPEGKRVTWSIADSCGECPPCVQFGMPQKCRSLFKYGHASIHDGCGLNGCYATHILLRKGTHIVPVPNHVPDKLASPVNCALATMVNALEALPSPCDSVLIQGAGMLGLYGAALLADMGIRHVFCTDIQPGRLELAAAFGAAPVDGRPAAYPQARQGVLDAAPCGVDSVVEVAGNAGLVPEGLSLLRPGGAYVFVGMVHPDTSLSVTGEQIVRKCATIRGVHNYAPRHLDAAIDFIARTLDRFAYDRLVGSVHRLQDLESAVQDACTGQWPRVAVAP